MPWNECHVVDGEVPSSDVSVEVAAIRGRYLRASVMRLLLQRSGCPGSRGCDLRLGFTPTRLGIIGGHRSLVARRLPPMPAPSSPSLLLAQALTLQKRATVIASRPTESAAGDRLDRVELEIQNVRTWLAHLVAQPGADRSSLADIETRLRVHAATLDDLEDLLRRKRVGEWVLPETA